MHLIYFYSPASLADCATWSSDLLKFSFLAHPRVVYIKFQDNTQDVFIVITLL